MPKSARAAIVNGNSMMNRARMTLGVLHERGIEAMVRMNCILTRDSINRYKRCRVEQSRCSQYRRQPIVSLMFAIRKLETRDRLEAGHIYLMGGTKVFMRILCFTARVSTNG